jgi:hypothetical protein
MSIAKAILTSGWFWTIVILITLIMVLPFIFILLILMIDHPLLRAAATLTIVICWGAAAGYADWVLAKNKRERKRKIP